MAFRWGDEFGVDDDDDNAEDSTGNKWEFGSKDGLIFLIDCTASMFQQSGDGSPFDLCIKCAKTVIQNKIISSNKDLISVVFFGTEKSKNTLESEHVYVLHDLDQPGAERVLQLEDLINEPDNDDFSTNFGHSNKYSLSDALWTCSDLFSKSAQKLGFKRVMLFTNNDDPHKNSAQLQRQAMTKVEDLHQNGISIELMHINKDGEVFDVNSFYKDILFGDDEDFTLPDPADRFDELLRRCRSKDHKKRALTRLTLNMSDNLNFSVGIYNMVRSCYKPAAVKLYKKTNEEVKSVTRTILEDTAELLMPQDLKKAQIYAGKKICFDNEEVTEIKTFGEPGLKLLGFKPSKRVKKYFHVKPGQFIYPDESTYEGSTCIFSALLKKCLERDVVAICRYIPRKNTIPRFVALIPQMEELDDHNIQIAPPGFHLMFLPFADDFRKVKLDTEVARANVDQIDAAKQIVKKLQYNFDPSDFENPALQTHYVNVEAMALDRDEPDEVHDCTEPNEGQIDKKAGKLISSFKDMVFPEDYVPGAKKRSAASGGAAAKRTKLDPADIDIEKEAKASRLNKLTVPILKEFVKSQRLDSASQKKADLIEAINEHFGV